MRALKAGRVLPIFPEGHIVPASGRRLDEMKPGTAYLAIHARVPVIPAYIYGTPETNEIIESLLTPSRARVIFGDPIDLSDIARERAGDKEAQAEVSARFKRAFLSLQAGHARFRNDRSQASMARNLRRNPFKDAERGWEAKLRGVAARMPWLRCPRGSNT